MCNLGRTGTSIGELFRFQLRTLLFWCLWISTKPPNSSGICRNMGNCGGFRAVAAREKYPGFIEIKIRETWTLSQVYLIVAWWCIYICIRELHSSFNTLRPRQNGRHFADDVFKCIFLNENVWIPIEIPLKFVPQGPINNISALVQIMAWRRSGDKPLSEPMMVSLPTHICVTWPQWWPVTYLTPSHCPNQRWLRITMFSQIKIQ